MLTLLFIEKNAAMPCVYFWIAIIKKPSVYQKMDENSSLLIRT